MTSDRFTRLETLYHAARARPVEARAGFLAEACGGDEDLRREVESLLAQPGVGVVTSMVVDARPALASGTVIGAYRIVEQIAAGGMGEVYRAHDTKLGRDVAVKVLPPTLANDRDRLARLEREARLLAALNHPNIAHVYGLEESNGTRALVMELVEGETLAERIARGPVPITEALPIARQMCEALEAAHDHGIIHRDLKPANVKVRPDGTVKVLDFGLAKVVDTAAPSTAGASPTQRAAATLPGLILGTAAYMSPEQASGKPVDRRTDLWAFGAVFMEMLTGRQVFGGESVSHVLAAVLTAEPEWSTLPPATPGGIHRLLRRCLHKDRRKRLDSAAVAALEIEDASGTAEPWSHSFGTPSPAMVAATPTTGAVAPTAAWCLLTAIVGGSVAIAQAGGTSIAPSQVPKPPEVLAERAREILSESTELPVPSADRAFWWWSAEADDRVRFTYRDSSSFLIPANLFRFVLADDPAPDPTRMRMVTLEADGTLSTRSPTTRTVWSRPTGGMARGELVYWVLILSAFVASCVLARRSLRAGEGDRRGAWRLGVTVGLGSLLFAALEAHHVSSVVDELAWLLGVTGWAGLWGAFCWLAYVGFEPYGRRWWPSALISWTRVLAGRFLDPLVGRHILLGLCVGIMSTALAMVYSHFARRNAPPFVVQIALEALRSSAAFGGGVVAAVVNAVVTSLGTLAVLVSFRLIFHRTWLAAMALTVLAIPAFANGTSGFDIALTAILLTVNLVVLLKLGVIAHMALLVISFLMWLPLTLDPNAWFFGQSLSVVLLIAALATYAFLAALGGRPAFGVMEPT